MRTRTTDAITMDSGGGKGSRLALRLVATPRALPAAGNELPLAGRLVLGREAGAEGISLADSAVSRNHVEIVTDTDRNLALLADLGSRNGTFVNGLGTRRRYLEPGDVIRIGKSLLIVVELDAVPGEPVPDGVPEMIGSSLAMRRVRGALARAADSNLPVLLLAETGCGKELAAAAIHRLSGRTGRYLPVNCAAVAESLFESTFFGHRKGAFTGATEHSPGLLRSCDHGTLFLDEVGELPLALQAKLLRFLEDGLVQAVGDTQQVRVDVRIVAATNARLGERERGGTFRKDLLGRLEGHVVRIPPLAERREDIPLLLDHFARLAGIESPSIDVGAMEALLIAPWDKNVRALRTLVTLWAERTQRDEAVLNLSDLPEALSLPVRIRQVAPEAAAPGPSAGPPGPLASRPSKEELLRVLRGCHWDIPTVAEHFGKHRKQVHRWMEYHGIERPKLP